MRNKEDKQKFLEELLDEFRDHVIDSYKEGCADHFEDHFDFLESCLEVFIDMKNDEEQPLEK